MNPSRKNPSRKSLILAFIGFAALAWIKLDRITTLATTGTPETACGQCRIIGACSPSGAPACSDANQKGAPTTTVHRSIE